MNKILLVICSVLLSWNAGALELAGIQLADRAQVGNASLQLNGAGIRTKLFFKVYVGALYLTQKQTSGEAIIADEGETVVAGDDVVTRRPRGGEARLEDGASPDDVLLQQTSTFALATEPCEGEL